MHHLSTFLERKSREYLLAPDKEISKIYSLFYSSSAESDPRLGHPLFFRRKKWQTAFAKYESQIKNHSQC